MRVLALGGAGEFGRYAVRILASSGLVSEILIAGRNIKVASSVADETGSKAKAVAMDVSDHDGLLRLAKDCDIVVNTAGPEYETVLKALESSIEAGTNYCDIGGDGPTTEKALELESAAKTMRITALLGIGACPGIATLMMLHAAHQLDWVGEVCSCVVAPATAFGITGEVVRSYRKAKHVSAGWQMFMKWATPPFHDYRNGALTTVREETDEVIVAMPGNNEVPAVLVGGAEAVTIPRFVPEVQGVHTLFSWFPFQLNRVYRELGGRVAKGELDESEAALAFFDQVVPAQERGQEAPAGLLVGTRWAEAVGTKEGKRMKYTCWPASGWFRPNPTPVALAIAALKILGGEIKAHGVLTPEACLDPLDFFKEVARQQLRTDDPGKLLNETWQAL